MPICIVREGRNAIGMGWWASEQKWSVWVLLWPLLLQQVLYSSPETWLLEHLRCVLKTPYPWGGRSSMIPWYFLWSFLSFMGNSLSEFSTAVPRQFQNIFADTEGKKAISGKVTDEKSIYVWSPFLRRDSFVLGTKKNSSSACSADPQNCFNWEKMVQK